VIDAPMKFACLILSQGLFAQFAASEVQTCGRISTGAGLRPSRGAFRAFRLVPLRSASAPIETISPNDAGPSPRNRCLVPGGQTDGSGALPGRPEPFFRLFDTSALETGGQRMWGDVLVASGMMLPALVYGAVLFVNYLQ
jgi:hypothetical protein